MKHSILFLFVFSFPLFSFAQCTTQLQDSDNCLGSTSTSFLKLNALSVPNPASIVWSVSPSEGVVFGTINGSDNTAFQAVFSQSGLYTVSMSSDGCGVQEYEFVVYPLGSFQTNVLSDYSLCNGTQFIEFDVLNPENFSSFQWSGIENVGDNTTNFLSTPSFSSNFTNPQNFLLTIQVEDLNGCSYLNVFPVNVNAGPTLADFNLDVLSSSDDCVLPGEAYSLDFVLSSSFSIQSFAPQTYLISSSNDSQVSQENFAIPVQVSFENECVIERSILHAHSIFYQTHFSSDFDGVLCAGEEITLINDSPHLTSSTSEYFTWSGIPSENILAESANSISFAYDVDGEYTWTLAYDDGTCSSQFDTTVTVDVDLIDVLYSVNNSIVCQDAASIEFSNESSVGNASYSYAWSIANQVSGFSYESAEENPVILVSGLGSYDVSLEVSSLSCSASSEILGMVSIVGASYFTTDFDGVLCAGEEITLINESPHLTSSTSEFFTWSGIPSENILSESASSISFNYDVDGEYNWTLAFDDGFCSSQFDTTVTVDLDLIDVLYSVDNSIVCQDSVTSVFSNESTVGNASYSYAWSVANQASGFSYESAQENPFILLSSTGSYDVSLEVSSLNCSASSEILGMVSVVGLPYFTTDFDGVLCAGEEITLINQSPHLTPSTSEFFTWSGIPSENILAESANSISFTYDVDGEYNWTLAYDDGLCVGIYDSIYSVNVDFIEPLLSENLNQLSCEFSSTLALSDQTVLDSGINDSYLYAWNLIPTSAEYDSSISLSSNELTPTFTINSSQAQSYSLSLDIVNQSTNCSGSEYYEGFFSVGGILVDMISEPLIVCDQAWVVTNDFIISDEIDLYDYFWTFSFEGIEQYSSTLFSDSVFLDQPGSYDVTLDVSDPQCSSETLNSVVTLYTNPTIENTLLDVVVCSLPLDSTFVIPENTPNYGSETFEWVLLDSSNSILATNDGPNFTYLFESNDSYTVELALVNDSSLCTTNTQFSIDIESIENTISSNTLETCLPSDVFLSTENNALLNSFEWNLYSEETLVYEGNTSQISTDLPVGIYDVELITETNNGCVSVVVNENFIAVNNYNAVINTVPLNICFNGSLNVSQEFSSIITGELLTIPVNVSSFTWNILSSNPSSVTQTSVDTFTAVYEFTKPGSYELVYAALVDGTSSTCSYSDTLNFNVGVDASITYDNTICVGEEFSALTDADTWSSGKIYEWSGSPDLLINTPSLASTIISSETSINPDILSNYNLSLTVTNDVGCWETAEEIVEVYQVSADFTRSDPIIHCNSQEIVLTSLYNTYISNWTWLVSDNTNETVYNQTNPVFNYSVTGDAYSSIELTIQSEHGCTAVKSYEDIVYANNYSVEIDTLPSNICFNGALSTSQSFVSSLSSDSLGLFFDLISYNWNIVSPNSAFASQTTVDTFSVVYEFTKPGLYYLEYAAIIDGTNTNCIYTDTLEFNVGVDASITYDNTICVGEDFFATTNADTWSTGKTYEWSGTSDLLLESPNLFSTAFSTETELGAGVTTNYELSLTVTNDEGCWETKTETIEAYQVVADFTVSDSIIHCSAQEVTLSSLNNAYITNWTWTINETNGTSAINQTNPIYTHLFSGELFSDINFSMVSEHGCSDSKTLEDIVFINNYTAAIDAPPSNICFDGASTVLQNFTSSITPDSLGLPYAIVSYNWQISSSNSTAAIQASVDTFAVSYQFNEPGTYTLAYSALIDGTNSDCEYRADITFNVGVDASITYDNTICVGGLFGASSEVDLWSASHSYEWSGTSDLLLASPNLFSTAFSTQTVLGAGVTTNYELSLTVTNDVGCWEIETETIEVYEVVADFTASESILNCSPQEIVLTSLNNSYVDNWDWAVFIEDPTAIENSPITYSTIQTPSFLLDSVAIYNFSLLISSVHGCSDVLYVDSVVILDGIEPDIQDVDGVICFNGDSVINKHFDIDYNSLYNNPINAINYSWVISPEVSISYQDESNLYLAFNETNEYTITYSFTLDSGNGESCFYSIQKLISIGVNATLFVPEIICEGAPFDAEAQVSIGIGAASVYEWSTSSSIDFSNPNSLQSNITANGNLSANQVVAYELGFKVTNDLGCWEEQQEFVEVYHTVADFYASDSAEVCAPAILSFSSLYNNFVSSYEWSYEGENYAGDYLSKIYTQNTDIIGDFFDEMAIYDFTLSINSEHGCTDTITKSSYVDIKRPYPYFTLEADYACDDEVINVIDSSYYSSNISLYTQNVIFDSTFYNLNSSTFIAYDFPYNQTTEHSYNFPITLNAYLGQCSRSHSDTVTIFVKPVLNFELSDSIGCAPFLVNFIDSTTFVVVEEASYFWDFGDGSVASTQNATHIYTIPGVYEVYHSVTSADGCTSDTILSNTIRVFEYPESDFTFVSDLFCYGEADVSFENTSIYVTDSIYSLWNVNDGTPGTSTLEDIVVHFDTTGVYQVNLQITDLNGCVDNSSQIVEVNILDTLVNDVSIDFVTISDDGITVVWEDNPDDFFESINVYTRADSGNWVTIYSSQSIVPNSYLHENAFTSRLNEYAIAQMDSCGYFSDSSTVHAPVLLEVNSEIYQTVRLNWTNYIGWSDVEYYEVFRSEDAQNYDLIANLSPDTLFYTDSNLCNILYSYYIVAHHPNGEFMSRSNKKFIVPMFVDFTIPLELSYTSVFNNNYILTEWDVIFESPITYYKLDRWDAYFGWLEEVALISEPPYLDQDVGVFNQTYTYRVSYADQCGNLGPESNLGTSILLKGEQYASHYYLSWNAYEGWLEGVENYVVQYFNNSSQNYENIEILPNTTFDYTDADLAKVGIDSSYCYRVVAISSENNKIMSISNDRCFISAPNNYFPNAFSPNNDDLNDTFKFEGLFAKSMTINIFDRQGGLVYSSDDVAFEWDGTFKESGVECANGTYSLHFEIVGFDGTKIRNDYPIFLIR